MPWKTAPVLGGLVVLVIASALAPGGVTAGENPWKGYKLSLMDYLAVISEGVEPPCYFTVEYLGDTKERTSPYSATYTVGDEEIRTREELVGKLRKTLRGYPVTIDLRKLFSNQEVRKIHPRRSMPPCVSPTPPT